MRTAQIEVCEQECTAGSAAACGTAAEKYSRGIGVKKNVKKSLELGVRGCELGDADGCDVAGLTYSGIYDAPWAVFENQAVREGIARRRLELLQRDCDAADGDACGDLAFLYEKDWYVPIRVVGDPKKSAALAARSVQLHQQACDRGDGYACNELAKDQLKNGAKDDQPDLTMRRACELGYAPSCSLAGLGEGSKGVDLFRRGCDLGDSESCAALAADLRIKGDDAEAARVQARACHLRDGTECKKLGKLLRETDPSGARIAFQQACALGDQESCAQ